jgi:hypothetical protein
MAKVPAHDDLGRAISGRRRRLVGDDPDPDAARDRVVERRSRRAGAGIELAGAERCHHVGGRAEIADLGVDPLGAEEAFPLGDVDRRIAGRTGGADRDSCAAAAWAKERTESRAASKTASKTV